MRKVKMGRAALGRQERRGAALEVVPLAQLPALVQPPDVHEPRGRTGMGWFGRRGHPRVIIIKKSLQNWGCRPWFPRQSSLA